ncbi:MAG: hypothetical protein CO167_05945 [Candidatus Marinimicrobia bacterium CG_4_9_14_3_um_filter_48_9]|nr:MAG: hypothetical protein CO167_05945 [Candidatus Marinimicrobia bacterium CG_4_9_14_3_um_filter_48_9]
MRFEWHLARRYLFSHKQNQYISLVSVISILGMTVGVAALIIAMSVLNGFEQAVTGRIINFLPHVVLQNHFDLPAGFAEDPDYDFGYRYTERKALLTFDAGRQIVDIQAVELPHWPGRSKNLPFDIYGNGRLPRKSGELPGIVLGYDLSEKLMISLGDTLRLLSPLDLEPTGARMPQTVFVVTGLFDANVFDYDKLLCFIDYTEGRRLFRQKSQQTGWQIWLKDYRRAEDFYGRHSAAVPNTDLQTWYQRNQTLFEAMTLEKWGTFVGLNFIILVAVFNVVSALMMLVLEKTGEIGILRVLGATSLNIRRIFITQGMLVAVIGILAGAALGLGFVLGQTEWQWVKLPQDIYFVESLPVVLSVTEVIVIIITAFIITWLAARYPARRAAELIPVDAMNYNR